MGGQTLSQLGEQEDSNESKFLFYKFPKGQLNWVQIFRKIIFDLAIQNWKTKCAKLKKYLIPSLNIPSDEIEILEWVLEVTKKKTVPFYSKVKVFSIWQSLNFISFFILIQDPDGNIKIGAVLFPILSLVSHSCR